MKQDRPSTSNSTSITTRRRREAAQDRRTAKTRKVGRINRFSSLSGCVTR